MSLAARAAVLGLAWMAAGAAAAEVHLVQPGESLASIAEQKLGDRALWPLLYKANRDRIKDPARIYPGQELTLPGPEPAPPQAGAGPEAPQAAGEGAAEEEDE